MSKIKIECTFSTLNSTNEENRRNTYFKSRNDRIYRKYMKIKIL